jgi:putative phosphoesterase
MRYLILSDIHANLTALDTVLDTVKGRWDKVVCLGDVVGYGPDPNEVVDRIREIDATTIRGNHDKAGSGLANADDFNPVARNVALWTRDHLRPENREWLEKLPTGPITVDTFMMVHGAFRDEDEYVFAPAQALDSLLVGVLHFKPPAGTNFSTLTTDVETTYLLNPGSIGQPRDGDTRSAFAIADLSNNTVEFWRVPYDIEDVQKRMATAGLPEPLILRLSFGR